jgi:hypothetical protein
VTTLRKREKVIAFRVSDEEYQALQRACLETDTQSISAFAREAVNSVVAPCGPGMETTAASLDSRVRRIEEELKLLTQELKRVEQTLGFPADLA